jgi:hypothetical protein
MKMKKRKRKIPYRQIFAFFQAFSDCNRIMLEEEIRDFELALKKHGYEVKKIK